MAIAMILMILKRSIMTVNWFNQFSTYLVHKTMHRQTQIEHRHIISKILSTHLITLFSTRPNWITIAGLAAHSTRNFPMVLFALVAVQANHIWPTRALPCVAITRTCFCIRPQQVARALCRQQFLT